jgi:hypothetical protein
MFMNVNPIKPISQPRSVTVKEESGACERSNSITFNHSIILAVHIDNNAIETKVQIK